MLIGREGRIQKVDKFVEGAWRSGPAKLNLQSTLEIGRAGGIFSPLTGLLSNRGARSLMEAILVSQGGLSSLTDGG